MPSWRAWRATEKRTLLHAGVESAADIDVQVEARQIHVHVAGRYKLVRFLGPRHIGDRHAPVDTACTCS